MSVKSVRKEEEKKRRREKKRSRHKYYELAEMAVRG